MRVTACWAGIEFDLELSLPSLSFYLGETRVDDEPEPEPPMYSSQVGTLVGFTANIPPQWDDQGSLHTLDPDDDREDKRRL